MKKATRFLLCLILIGLKTNAQVTTSANTTITPTTDYVGWNNALNNVLRIKTEGNKDIEFYTNTGAGTFGTPKMMLDRAGYLGIGTGTTSPSSWLHVITSGTTNAAEPFRTDVVTGYDSNWRMYKAGSHVLRIYSPTGGDAVFMQSIRGDMKFSSGTTTGTNTPAFMIRGGTGSDAGNVLIGDYSSSYNPTAVLHIKGRGYTSLLKVMNSTLTTPTLEVTEGDQVFFKSVGFTGGGTTAAAFKFDYSPTSAVTYASGTLDNVTADASSYMIGRTVNTNNTNTSSGTALSYGIWITANSNTPAGSSNKGIVSVTTGATSNNWGADFQANGSGSGNNTGLYCGATAAQNCTGVYAHSDASGATVAELTSRGILTKAYGAATVIGLEAEASEDQDGNVYAIKCEAVNGATHSGTNSWYGIHASAPAQACSSGGCAGAAGFFNGEVYSTGAMYASSDLKVKDQIAPLLNSSAKLALLQPKQYVFKTTSFPGLNLSEGLHYGFIAQDIETVLPELVKEFKNPEKIDSVGNIIYPSVDIKSVNYTEIIPLLVNAFNEQKLVIDSLLNALQNPTPIINPTNTNKIQLSNNTGFILNQNDPNPFTESTVITYNIPEAVNSAKIIFTNSTGVIINTIVIGERGSGQLEVYASDLSKGIYVYSLVCDGKVIASKKMVKQ